MSIVTIGEPAWLRLTPGAMGFAARSECHSGMTLDGNDVETALTA